MLQKVETTTIQFNSNLLATFVFVIWNIVKYFKQGELPFSYQEGGYWTIVLLFAGALVGFASQTVMYFASDNKIIIDMAKRKLFFFD